MLRWYLAFAVAILASSALQAQNGATGNTGGNAGTGTATGGRTGGLAGTVNTTLLGADVNLNFNSVFGNSATLANTNTDPFSAYRPSGSATGSSAGATGSGFAGTSFSGGSTGGNTFAGTGMNTGGIAGNRNTTGGIAGNRTTGGIAGNRNTTGGVMGNRQTMGMLGGNAGGLFGGGFLGGGMNQQQQNTINMGYTVNFDGMNSAARTNATTVTPNVELQQRLTSAPGMQGASNLQVMMRGETAIIRGTVTTDYAKQLAAAMLRLEPGVYEVQNELTISPK
jgi:hypothetical protein